MSDKEGDEDARHDEQDNVFWREALKQPIPIHLHSSLGKAVSKSLAKKVKDHGGNPKADEDNAEVIICRQEGPAFVALTKKYDHERYKWVEAPSWVDYCIKEKRYDHPIRPPLLKPHTGGRTQYTPADDNHIVEFLAKRIPYRDMKGRSGQKVWKDLCERADLYPWAVKHSWQSWRERYVKNNKIFDDKIEKFVSSDPDPPVRGGKGQYRVDHGKRGPRNRPRFDDIQCVAEEENEEIDIEKGLQSGRKRVAKKPAGGASPSKRRRVAPSPEIDAVEEEEEADEEENGGAAVIQYVEDSQPGPSNDVSSPMVQTNTWKASPLPLFLPEERENTPARVEDGPRAASPTVSEAEQPFSSKVSHLSKPKSLRKSSRKRSGNASANTNASTAQRAPSVAVSVDQQSLMDTDDAAPASRTRSRSRQPSVEPSAQQPTQPTRTRRTRATASPPPPQPPSPTLTSQEPRTIDLKQYQIRRRDPTRPVLRPALIPIPELPEGSQPRLTRVTTTMMRDELPAWETLQTAGDGDDGKSGSENSDNGDDGDRHDDHDDDANSDSDLSGMSDMIQLNEGIKALTEQTMKKYAQEDVMINTSATRVARKMPHTSPPPLNDQSSDEEYENNENEAGESENDNDGEEDSHMTGVESLNTQTSVPAVGTNARKYLTSLTPFTPARGTLAQERVSSERTTPGRLLRERKVDKGKGRAR